MDLASFILMGIGYGFFVWVLIGLAGGAKSSPVLVLIAAISAAFLGMLGVGTIWDTNMDSDVYGGTILVKYNMTNPLSPTPLEAWVVQAPNPILWSTLHMGMMFIMVSIMIMYAVGLFQQKKGPGGV